MSDMLVQVHVCEKQIESLMCICMSLVKWQGLSFHDECQWC